MHRVLAAAVLAPILGFPQVPSLSTSSYFGGREEDSIRAAAFGPDGSLYLAGSTSSRDLPVRNAQQPACTLSPRGSCSDAFLARFTADGRQLIFSTFLGSDRLDAIHGLAIDQDGSAVVVGNYEDWSQIHVTRFSAQGQLLSRTVMRGTAFVQANAVALDRQGRIYVAGQASGFQQMPPGGFQTDPGPAACPVVPSGFLTIRAFVIRFTPSLYPEKATYYGGNGVEIARALAVAPDGDIWLVGETSSTNLPLVNPLQSQYRGGARTCEGGDAFVARLDADLETLRFSTYLGGAGPDSAAAIALDSTGTPAIAGTTYGAGFPTPDTPIGGSDVFLTRLTPDGSRFLASRLYGGSHLEIAYAVAFDSSDALLVAGSTASFNLPLAFPLQPQLAGCLPGQPQPCYDAFVARFTAAGLLDFATYLGGDGDEYAQALAVSPAGVIAAAGLTYAANFPTSNAFQSAMGGLSSDGFFATLTLPAIPAARVVSAASDAIQTVAPGSLAAITGDNLAPGFAAAPYYNLDFSPAGITVEVEAPVPPLLLRASILSVTPSRIIFQVPLPSNLAPGEYPIHVKRSGRTTHSTTLRLQAPSPALFTANGTGTGAAAAIAMPADPSGPGPVEVAFQCAVSPGVCTTSPITAGAAGAPRVLALYGTGFAFLSSPASARIGGAEVPIVRITHGILMGLDEIVLSLPPALAGTGRQMLEITIAGQTANSVEVEFR